MALLTMALPIPRLSAPRTRQKPSNDDGLLPEQSQKFGLFGLFEKSPAKSVGKVLALKSKNVFDIV
jgi:hypothetical protein